MAINILDSLIINRISAGEVVESPFSIVKELVDNSIDAGADKISVEIENGGIDKIVVKDNGKGIEQSDIVKAFLPHATSKIKDLTDLDAIATLGFRGEALASISNVSKTLLTTKTAGADCAYSLRVDGGDFGVVTADSSENGTKIEVRDLFFNTPARRKFLKKPKQEETKITDIISRYILAHPNINFKYIVDGKIVYQSNGGNLLDAIYCVYGAEFTQNIIPIEKSMGNVTLSGYVSKVGFSKPNTTYQTLIVNNRYVVDEIVSKAVYMANEEYLMTRQFPVYVLKLDMPAIDVDVNVHPVREAIYSSLNPTKPAETSEEIVSSSLINTDINSLKEIEIEPNATFNSFKPITLKQTSYSPITMFDVKSSTEQQPIIYEEKPTYSSDNILNTQHNDYKSAEDFADFKIIGQLFNEFLVLEKGDKMLLLDFHAGHERLNYDKFTAMVNARDVVVQNLLVPYVHELNEQEVQFILSLKPALYELGFDVDAFGDKKIVINSVPMQLKDINLKEFVNDLIHDMKNLKPDMNNEIRHYLMQKACKSSVKAGMVLSEMEIKELLKNLDENHPVLLCPHGRPIVTIISREQIEKWFKRIV